MGEEEKVETPKVTEPVEEVAETATEPEAVEEKPATKRGRKRKVVTVEAEQTEEKPAEKKVTKRVNNRSAKGQTISGTYRVYDTYLKTSNSRLVTGNFKVVTRVNGLLEVQYMKPGFGLVKGYLEQ